MNQRERFLALTSGVKPDRMPYVFGGPRSSTFAAWRRQGLTPEIEQRWSSFLGEEGFSGLGKVDCGPIPHFQERVITEDGHIRVWVDHYGVTRVDAVSQPTPGFATRRYLDFPVKNSSDFAKMRERYDPKTPERLIPVPGENQISSLNPDGYRIYQSTAYWRDHVGTLNASVSPVCLTVPGFWWTSRDWAGFEGLCYMCSEQPLLVAEMMEFWAWFLMELLDEPLRHVKIDMVMVNEDMGYKHAAMISPAMMRQFMLQPYFKFSTFLKERGVKCVMMDSDGHCAQVLEVFHPTAIDGIAPMEVAANNDPETYLLRHPNLFVMGGIDKRELRNSREELRAEVVKRFRLARETNRYLPTVDHGVPPDVPLRNYVYMAGLMRGFADGADLDSFEPDDEMESSLGPVQEMFDPEKAINEAWGEE